MKQKVTILFSIVFALISLVITGCGNNNAKPNITHIPVQLKSEGNWSLVDVNTGKLLYEGEFKHEPSIACEGVFVTKNKNGELFYNKIIDDKKYEQIAGPFVSGNMMKNNIAIVCKADSYPMAINADGEEIFNLEPRDGVKFASVGQCFDGKIQFKAENGLCGFLNEKGEIVIEPQFDYVDDFNHGIARATMHSGEKNKLVLIDDEGEVITEIDKSYVGSVNNGKLVYSEDNDEFGILRANKDLDKIIGSSSKYEGINIIGDDIFYSTDRDWGLMKEDGESVIRPKYKVLTRLTGDVLLGVKIDGEDMEYHLLDNEGEIQKKDEVDGDLLGVLNLNNGNFLRKDGKEFQILNSEGEVVGDASFKRWSGFTEISMLNSHLSYMVSSEFFDWSKIESFISSMRAGAVNNFKLGMNCVQGDAEMKNINKGSEDNKEESKGRGLVLANKFMAYDDYNGTYGYFIGSGYGDGDSDGGDDDDEMPTADSAAASPDYAENSIKDDAPEWGTYQSTLIGSMDLGKAGYISLTIGFDENIKKTIIQPVPVTYGYFEYTENRIVGYEKNLEAKLNYVDAYFSVKDKQAKKLHKMLDSHFAKNFNFMDEYYGWKKYSDQEGNIWEVKDSEVKLSRNSGYGVGSRVGSGGGNSIDEGVVVGRTKDLGDY